MAAAAPEANTAMVAMAEVLISINSTAVSAVAMRLVNAVSKRFIAVV